MGTNLMGNQGRPEGRFRKALWKARELLSDEFEGWKERREIVRSMNEHNTHPSLSGSPPSRHAVRNLSMLLEHDDSCIRSKAAHSLRSLCLRGYRIENAIPALVSNLTDDSIWVRMDSASALKTAATRSSFPGIYSILEGINRLAYSEFLEAEVAHDSGSACWTIEAMLDVLNTVRDATTITSIGRTRLESLMKSMDARLNSPRHDSHDETA